jgi:sulfate adenylyltransferase subunit 2
MHVDTGHNFPQGIEFRDRTIKELETRLIVASVEEAIEQGRVVEETGPRFPTGWSFRIFAVTPGLSPGA